MEIDTIDVGDDDQTNGSFLLPRWVSLNILDFLVAPKIDRTREKSTIQTVFDGSFTGELLR